MFAVRKYIYFPTVIVYHKIILFSMDYSMNYSRIYAKALAIFHNCCNVKLCRLTDFSFSHEKTAGCDSCRSYIGFVGSPPYQWVRSSMATKKAAMTQELTLIFLISPQKTLITM